MTTAQASRPAFAPTDAQLRFFNTLLAERGLPTVSEFAPGTTRRQASEAIECAKTLPRQATSQAQAVAEPGVYEAPDGSIYVVKPNKAGTNLYAKRLVEFGGDRLNEDDEHVSIEFQYEAGAIRRLTPAMKMPMERAKALTIRYGRCIVCGRKLRDGKSVEQGIGPVCRKSFA